jgi:hypothetical protein
MPLQGQALKTVARPQADEHPLETDYTEGGGENCGGGGGHSFSKSFEEATSRILHLLTNEAKLPVIGLRSWIGGLRRRCARESDCTVQLCPLVLVSADGKGTGHPHGRLPPTPLWILSYDCFFTSQDSTLPASV